MEIFINLITFALFAFGGGGGLIGENDYFCFLVSLGGTVEKIEICKTGCYLEYKRINYIV